MKKLALTGFLFLCGVVFYYTDPMHLFSLADDKLSDIINEDYEIDSSEDSSNSSKEHHQQIMKPSNDISSEDKSAQSIIDSYTSTLHNLKKQVEDKLDKLLEEAYQEYEQGEDATSLPALYLKYNQAIQELEQKTDQSFQEVYQELQNELEANGYDPGKAESVKEEYEKIKKETRSVMTERVMEKFEV
ncbi:hypothetical protein SAMN05421676_101281 [Salinibacillus kushneri]|uniref:Uncharacterized protein n=1 Tax=Salinibacillus kushneri TaxID=237682 RepID=A0A1H9YST9_9BACI|nr:hypothetical protein [Salinibacillus kushneri]SES72178.1 hypothetical protein SAMN05421676_101281 [Salinibacillus kushneri]